MQAIRSIIAVAALALIVAGCTSSQVAKIQNATENYNKSIASINASIAATAPLTAKACGDLQTAAMLLAPVATKVLKGDGPEVFAGANAALTQYCQAAPTDINSTVAALISTYNAAMAAYRSAKGK